MLYRLSVKTFLDGAVQMKYYPEFRVDGHEITFCEYMTRWGWKNSAKELGLDIPDDDYSENTDVLDKISRAKQQIFDIARSNHWDWMVTFTLSPDYCDRSNYDDVVSLMRKWTHSTTQRGIKWLLVPEFHKDENCYHFHGLIQGDLPVARAHYPPGHRLEGKPMSYLSKRTGELRDVYNVSNFRYGWSTATMVTNSARASGYITKYMTKETLSCVPKGKNRYIASKSLLRPTIEKVPEFSAQELQDLISWERLIGLNSFDKTYTDVFGNDIILHESSQVKD